MNLSLRCVVVVALLSAGCGVRGNPRPPSPEPNPAPPSVQQAQPPGRADPTARGPFAPSAPSVPDGGP